MNDSHLFTRDCQDHVLLDENVIWKSIHQKIEQIPKEYLEISPGLKWGHLGQLFTPAFWKLQYLLFKDSNKEIEHRISDCIVEEIIVCLLGGYGIPSEMGTLAFRRLKEQGLCTKGVSYEILYATLSKPFNRENGREIRYRFAAQKSKYIYLLLNYHDLDSIPQNCDISLRKWLLKVDGIGLKTASWITRNWTKSDKVAILDIHLLRAGKLTGFFDNSADVTKSYLELEEKYLVFCSAIGVAPSDFDAVIWSYMKKNNRLAIKNLN